MRQWNIIGVGSGWGAQDMGTADGPKVLLANSPPYFQQLPQKLTYWHENNLVGFSNPVPLSPLQASAHADQIFEMAAALSVDIEKIILQGNLPLVLGGDHSIAIGAWSGVKAALKEEEMGLIWIDAHMDAHTPGTSPSHNMHGMPVAILLGEGERRFTHLRALCPKLKPENVCLVGVRSFEEGEATLLKQLGVRVYTMKDIQKRGFPAVFQEARRHISASRFGLSIDVDAFDPLEAPGTGTPENFGLREEDVKTTLHGLAQDPAFLGLEITEFNPHRDIQNKTRRLVWDLVTRITGDTSC